MYQKGKDVKRRDFLKILGISPIVPSVLMAKEKPKKFNTEGFGGWNPKDGWVKQEPKIGLSAVDFCNMALEKVSEPKMERLEFNCGEISSQLQSRMNGKYWRVPRCYR